MSALARAFAISEVENDPRIVEGMTKECGECDVDNPRAVPREGCMGCMGTGRQPLAAATIASEISNSRRGLSAVPESENDDGSSNSDDDLYLEY